MKFCFRFTTYGNCYFLQLVLVKTMLQSLFSCFFILRLAWVIVECEWFCPLCNAVTQNNTKVWFHLHPVSKFLVVVIYNIKSLEEVLLVLEEKRRKINK